MTIRTLLAPLALAALWLAALTGCASSSPRSTTPSMAIAISTPDAPPTSAQLTTIHQLLQPQIAKRGYTVAKDFASADYVMRVRFTPDPANPAGGHLAFLGIERNGTAGLTRPRETPAAEASAANLADLRKAIADLEWSNAMSK